MQDHESILGRASRVTANITSKWRRTIIAVIVTAFIIGTSGYLLGISTNQNASRNQLRPQAHISTINQSPTPAILKQALTSTTKRQFNSSGALSFYFTSQKPAFGPNDDPQDIYWINDDPFKICFNGDAYYSIPSTVYYGSADKYVITPYIFETDSRKSYALPLIGEVKAPNGCVRIIRWVDDYHLLRKACGGDLNESSCQCHLIDARKFSLKVLEDTGSTDCLISDKK
jgi:hypothetical protein